MAHAKCKNYTNDVWLLDLPEILYINFISPFYYLIINHVIWLIWKFSFISVSNVTSVTVKFRCLQRYLSSYIIDGFYGYASLPHALTPQSRRHGINCLCSMTHFLDQPAVHQGGSAPQGCTSCRWPQLMLWITKYWSSFFRRSHLHSPWSC